MEISFRSLSIFASYVKEIALENTVGLYTDHDASEAGGREQTDVSLLEGAQVEMHELNGHENEHMSTQLIGAQSIGTMMSTESPIN